MIATTSQIRTLALGLIGGVIGGTLGYFAFFWIVGQGFYAVLLPAALLGLGAGICARRRSSLLAAICGLAGIGLGLFTEWRFAPFIEDPSFSHFITHVHTLPSVTLILLGFGAFLSYRLSLGFG